MKTEINKDSVFIGGIEYIPKSNENRLAQSVDGLKCVMVRSYAAGVHFGYLKKEEFTQSGKVVTLVNTRRVWCWSGAASLSQLASEGSNKQSECKITVELPENEIVNVIETIPMTEVAINNLKNTKTWKQ